MAGENANLQLLSACKEGNLDEVDRLIKEVGDVDKTVHLGDAFTTPLIHAAKNGQYTVVKHLSAKCTKRLSIDKCDSDGRTVLHYACIHGELNIVKMLLDRLICIHAHCYERSRYKAKWTSVLSLGLVSTMSMRADHLGLQLYREQLAFVNGEDNEHSKPIMLAAKKDRYDIVSLLIAHGADVTCLSYDDGNKALSWTIGKCEWEAVNVLISEGFLGIGQFHTISAFECLSEIKKLYNSAISQEKILSFAIRNNLDTAVVTNLIVNGIGITGLLDTNPPMTALMWAAQNGDAELVKQLILQGVNVDGYYWCTGRSALQYAAENDHIQCGILLTEAGARVTKIFQPHLRYSKKFKEAIKGAYSFQSKKTICVIGNARSGKSTLIKSLENECAPTRTQWVNWIRGVKETSEQTAGIEPVPLSSEIYGDVIFLDFAGQHEYHGPHEMFLESILTQSRSTVTIIVVVKATDEESLILEQFERWLHPLSLLPNITSPVRVIPVASFMDKLNIFQKSRARSKMDCSYQIARENIVTTLNVKFLELCYLNCCQPYDTDFKKLCTYLNDIPIPSFKAVDTPYSICWVISQMNISIKEKAIPISSFSKWIADNKHNLPANLPSTEQLCKDLSSTGHFLYLPNREDPPSGWLILSLSDVLHKVYGTLFSPLQRIVDQFGLLDSAKLSTLFPDLNPKMVQDILIKMDFCIDVDPSLLEDVRKVNEIQGENYLFFPALVVQKPGSFSLGQACHSLCWQLVVNEKPYMSPRLLQTIILKLASRHAFCLRRGRSYIERHCRLWCNGIFWQSTSDVDVAVQITDNVVILVIGQSAVSTNRLCSYMSKVTQCISETIRKLSPALSANAYIIHPAKPQSLLKNPRSPSLTPHVMFPVANILKCTRNGAEECFSCKKRDNSGEGKRVKIAKLFCDFQPTEDILKGLLCDFPNESIKPQQAPSGDPGQYDACQNTSTDSSHKPRSTGLSSQDIPPGPVQLTSLSHDTPPGPTQSTSLSHDTPPGPFQGIFTYCSQRSSSHPTQVTTTHVSTVRLPCHNSKSSIPSSSTATSLSQRIPHTPLLEPPTDDILQHPIQRTSLKWYSGLNPQLTGLSHDTSPTRRTSYNPTQATSTHYSTERLPCHKLDSSTSISSTATSPAQRIRYNPLLEPPTNDILKSIIHRAALKWYSIGLYLDIEENFLKRIKDGPSNDVEMYCQTMFSRWLSHDRGTGGTPRTWQSVIDALNTVDFHFLAEELRGKICT
jgi:ankyrin repeat protein/GTPase SAR1 family protein